MFISFLLFPLLAFSHVIQDDVAVTERNRFSFKTVCARSFTHDSPLIEIASGTELDCMGKKADVSSFCDKEMAADPYYLRGYVDKEKKEVICVSGKKVLFKFLCVRKKDEKMCAMEAKKACEFIQDKLAKRLDLVHYSFLKNEKGQKQMNCFFESLPLKER